MHLQPQPISKIRDYLTINGLDKGSVQGDCETWQGKGKNVIICVSENTMPVIAIQTLLAELDDNPQDFMKIMEVVRK